MTTQYIELERHGRVLCITLNRPEKRNALNREMCEAITSAAEAAETDPALGSILFKSNGAVFCAGMDLNEAIGFDADEITAVHSRLFTLGARLTKPIGCPVRGPAIAGGLGLVANAHIVLAAHGSTFGLTEIRIGLWPYTIYRAVELALGHRRTVELTLSSKIFNTPEALAWGLVHEVLPSFELDDRALSIASTLAEASTETIQRGLRFTNESRGLSPDEAMNLALSMRSENFRSPDFQEGVKAFREKRAPLWPSRP